MQGQGRIEYIDAMRGFTMILVVYHHVSTFCMGMYGSHGFSYNDLFREFRMPLFFLVSGFVFYKAGREWHLGEALSFLGKKVWVQLLSPLLFLCASVLTRQLGLADALLNSEKAGYWFTFTLFEYFVFYILAYRLFTVLKARGWVREALLLAVGAGVYVLAVPSVLSWLSLDSSMLCNALGLPKWGYFLYFVLGTMMRRHFAAFERLLDRTPLVLLSVAAYVLANLFAGFVQGVSSTGFNLLVALTGIVTVFALFRRHQAAFSRTTRAGRIMQFIGRRTLDVYLLHYFFVFSHMQAVLPDFGALNAPFLEFVCSLAVALLVIAASLGVSQVLRLSPTMAHYLFGQKLEKRH